MRSGNPPLSRPTGASAAGSPSTSQASAPPDREARVAALLRLAENLRLVGDRARAAETYVLVAEQYLDEGRPLEAMAVGFRALQVDSEAFASTRATTLLRRIGPSAAPLCLRAIQAQLEAERHDAAVVLAEAMIAMDPTDLQARRDLAELYLLADRRDDALALLGSVCRRLAEMGADRELIATARQVLRTDPGHAPTLRRLVRACLHVAQPGAALAAVGALLATCPEDFEALELLAGVYMALRRPAEALATLTRLARALERAGEADRADLVLARAHEWEADDAFHHGLASLRTELGRLRAQGPRAPSDEGELDAVPDAPELFGRGCGFSPA